jgi:nitroimidazol reductase NimA-like FMN-containing flavoprotein (pyridoxamine 5'-phosphate oxidase superfamily)
MTRAPSARTTVRRHAERGAYDRETIHRIVDEGLICHVGFVHEGQPYVIPTLHARIEDTLYFQRSPPRCRSASPSR